jgi:ATP-dependent RNA helicase RhlE
VLAHFLRGAAVTRSLVFTRTKHGADRVVRQLGKFGIAAEAIHGNKTQTARQRALENFRSRATRVLVATDVAARGLDVDDISHVVNYDLPNVPETYVHRIGRTGRAGASGTALSFCDSAERAQLKAIEKLLRQSIPVQAVQPEVATATASAPHPAAARSSAPRAKSSRFGDGRAQKPAGAAKSKRFAVAGHGSRRTSQTAY